MTQLDYIRLRESISLDLGPKHEEIKRRALQFVESKQHIIIPRIECIHAITTRNYIEYPSAKLRGKVDFKDKEGRTRPTGTHSWTLPYNKPFIKNHDIRSEPLGRIRKAEFKNKTPLSGLPGVIVYPHITDPEAIEKFLDGRYHTVSIGTDTDGATCSICGANMAEEWCSHIRGRYYDDVLCKWTVHNIWFLELSTVNEPADENAMVIDIDELDADEDDDSNDTEATETEESFNGFDVLLHDLKGNRIHELGTDRVFAVTSNGLHEIPYSEFAKEYYYIPFTPTLLDNLKSSRARELGADRVEAKAGDDPKRPKGKDGKPIGKMKTGTKKQAYYGHNLLHGYWRKGNTSWTEDQIKSEHRRVVRIILNKGWKHRMIDSLDNTLPADLKKRSQPEKKESL